MLLPRPLLHRLSCHDGPRRHPNSCRSGRGSSDSLTVTLRNEQQIEVPQAVVRWLKRQGATPPASPNNQMSQITEVSILIRIHATTDTPDPVAASLTAGAHVAVAEVHDPRVHRSYYGDRSSRFQGKRRRRSVGVRLNASGTGGKGMARRESHTRGHIRIDQARQLWD